MTGVAGTELATVFARLGARVTLIQTTDRLLPLSVDGLILAASLVLLLEARNGRDASALARFVLWFGIGANIACGPDMGCWAR